MLDIFKAFTSFTAWLLFIFACIIGFSLFIQRIIIGELYSSHVPSMEMWAGSAVAFACAVGSAVVMLLRKKWE